MADRKYINLFYFVAHGQISEIILPNIIITVKRNIYATRNTQIYIHSDNEFVYFELRKRVMFVITESVHYVYNICILHHHYVV